MFKLLYILFFIPKKRKGTRIHLITEPAVDVDTEKPTESGSTVDKQGTTVPSMSEEPTTTAQGSQIKEETEGNFEYLTLCD